MHERFAALSDMVIGQTRELAGRRLRLGALLAVVSSSGYFAAYSAIILRTLHGEMTVGQLTFLAGSLAGASNQIQLVFSTFTSIAGLAFSVRSFRILLHDAEDSNADHPIPAPRRIQLGIEFQDVSFKYPETTRRVLDHLNFRIEAGERVAIVGPNGQGKTTLVKLMTRLYEPSAGRILLDGIDLREYDLEDLHSQIGVIFQDFMRYDLTVRDNIAMGGVGDHMDDARLLDAAMKRVEPAIF